MSVPSSPPPAARSARRFAGYLLTSSLGRDALGESFRALAIDAERVPRTYVRIRLFDSPELPRSRVVSSILAARDLPRPGPGANVTEDEEIGVDHGTPYLVWSESHAWSLDHVIESFTRSGVLSVGHALLVVDRIASALEHAERAGRAAGRHGLVWPGFVTIGEDGTVRLGGFGVAPAVLPHLSAPRLAAEIAPYVAPELRGGGPRPASADVYSVAAIATELLTGRRPPASRPADALSSAPALPRGISEALRAALAFEGARTPTVSLLRREIGGALVAARLSPSSRELGARMTALFAPRIANGEAASGTRTGVAASVADDDEWDRAIERLGPHPSSAASTSSVHPPVRVSLPPGFPARRGGPRQ
jgi:hypothetical protein